MTLSKYVFILFTLFIINEPDIKAQGAWEQQVSDYLDIVKDEKLNDCSIDIDGAIAQEGVRTVNPVLKAYYSNPSSLPVLLNSFSGMMLDPSTSFTEKSQYAFRLMGVPAGGIGPPLRGVREKVQPSQTEAELSTCIQELINKGIISDKLHENTAWNNSSYEIRNLIIYLVRVIEETNSLYKSYIKTVCPGADLERLSQAEIRNKLLRPLNEKQLSNLNSIVYYEQADLRKLSFASRMLMEYISRSMMMISKCEEDAIEEDLIIESKYGLIGFFGSDNDTIIGSYAVVVDIGGNDSYTGGFASTLDNESRVGILIDMNGNDTYHSEGEWSVCHANLGAAVLIDLAGDDQYEVSNPGLGSSVFGFSLLLDQDGDDHYIAHGSYSIASAIAGIAILYDENGHDVYSSRSYAQGFAGPLGAGMLIDCNGNDRYGQSGSGDISFVQGASKGRWAEATDGHSLAGGSGFLIDGGGNDNYCAGSFAQGAGYYFGAGFLSDWGGDDTYNAVSHSQAYGVHYAMACMLEYAGRDVYNKHSDTARMTQLIASGRDHSAGILLDIMGSDEYYFGNRSVGISDMQGIGYFIDLEGSDLFKHYSNSIYKGSGSAGKAFEAGGMMKRFRIAPLMTRPAAVFRDIE